MVASGKRVLVMDDEDVVCRSYEKVLTKAGFEVAKAHSGAEALAEAREHEFDVMLADLRMPGMGGLEVVRELRTMHPHMPVIVITGYPSQDTLQEAASLGVTDYLTKPVAPEVLTQATTQALTAPTWLEAAHRLAIAPATTTVPPTFPEAAPAPPLVVAEPPPPVVEEAAAPPVLAARPRRGVFRALGALVWVPIVSIAYVVFLPLAGFAVFFGLGAKALVRRFGRREA